MNDVLNGSPSTSNVSKSLSSNNRVPHANGFVSKWEVCADRSMNRDDLLTYFKTQQGNYKSCADVHAVGEHDPALLDLAQAHIMTDLEIMVTWMQDLLHVEQPKCLDTQIFFDTICCLTKWINNNLSLLDEQDDVVVLFLNMIAQTARLGLSYSDELRRISEYRSSSESSSIDSDATNKENRQDCRVRVRLPTIPAPTDVEPSLPSQRSARAAAPRSTKATKTAQKSDKAPTPPVGDLEDLTLDLNVSMEELMDLPYTSYTIPESPPSDKELLEPEPPANTSVQIQVKAEPLEAASDCGSVAGASTASSSSVVVTNRKKTVWMHRDRLKDEDVLTNCFVCRQSNSATGEPLSRCSFSHGNKRDSTDSHCPTRYHMSCIKEYNAGDFSADYMHSLVGEYRCPLHHCDLCWFDRKKTTAVTKDTKGGGMIIQCKKCYRAFHDVCRPAGGTIDLESLYLTPSNGRKIYIASTECQVHSWEKNAKLKTNKRSHLPFCCECEEKGNTPLLKCSNCIRSYHKDCRIIDEIKGSRYPEKHNICESCIHGESLRAGQHLIARYQSTFFPCTAVSLDAYPKHCTKADKYGAHLGNPAFMAVTWAGCQNLFSLLPACNLVPMFENSFHLIGRRMTDVDHRNAWEQMCENITVPRPSLNHLGEKYTKIKTSVYHSECERPVLPSVEEDTYMCDCKPNEPDRCGPNSKCTNRASNQECPELCEALPGKCNNRWMSKKETNPDIEVQVTEGKGQGVVATKDIPKGMFIAEYAGELISQKEKARRIALSAVSRNDEEKHYMMQLDSARVIDCKLKGNDARFLNHSCAPNCIVQTVEIVVESSKSRKGMVMVKYDRRVCITTLRDVKKGEELCFDYNMDEFSVGCPLPECLCGADNCFGKLGKSEEQKKEVRMRIIKQEPDVVKEKEKEPKAISKPKEKTPKRSAKKPVSKATLTPHDLALVLVPISSTRAKLKPTTAVAPAKPKPVATSRARKRALAPAITSAKEDQDLRRPTGIKVPKIEPASVDEDDDMNPAFALRTAAPASSSDEQSATTESAAPADVQIIGRVTRNSRKAAPSHSTKTTAIVSRRKQSRPVALSEASDRVSVKFEPLSPNEQRDRFAEVKVELNAEMASKSTYIDKINEKANLGNSKVVPGEGAAAVEQGEEGEQEMQLFTPSKEGPTHTTTASRSDSARSGRSNRGRAPSKLSP